MRPRIRFPGSFVVLVAGTLASFAAVPVVAEVGAAPLIRRAEPNPERREMSEAWLTVLDAQSPALDRALRELGRQRDSWRMEPGVARCRRARRALARVDRGTLLSVSDYPIVVAMGQAFDELDGAIQACSARRYFEFDYRLDRARRSLSVARETARRQTRP